MQYHGIVRKTKVISEYLCLICVELGCVTCNNMLKVYFSFHVYINCYLGKDQGMHLILNREEHVHLDLEGTMTTRALPQTLATRLHTASHSSTSSRGRLKALQNTTTQQLLCKGYMVTRGLLVLSHVPGQSSNSLWSQLRSVKSLCFHCLD